MDTCKRNLVGLLGTTVVRRVLDVSVTEGAGVEGNPVRRVRYLIDTDTGEVLARIDDCAGEEACAQVTVSRHA